MAHITEVGVTAGVPTSGTGEVYTIDQLVALLGPLTAAKETDPDAASATSNSLLRGILQSLIDGITTSGTDGVPASEFISVQPAHSDRTKRGTQRTAITNTTETTIVTAAASTYHDLYGVFISNSSATDTEVTIRDDTAGTILCVLSCPADQNNGFAVHPDGAIPQAVVNKPWTAQAADAATLSVTVLYIKKA